MKVLAIRARNLTSLERFELELERGPLAETRIFAITGPTGAGKSTILDAMCLALYDRAPRVLGAREAAIGDLEVAASDPRSLIRRGASEAVAEVDFESEGRGRYRATWEVWRARKRIDGRLQNTRMRLTNLESGAELGGATKTETLGHIEALVGLGYDEFRRAVLLAQNDFASFLDARPEERAALLERMTGTEIYAAVSRAAFTRAKLEESRLAALEAERARIDTLSPEIRASLETERALGLVARANIEAEMSAHGRAIAWLEAHRRLVEEHNRQVAELETARAERTALEPLVVQLTFAIEAERLRPFYEAKQRAHEGLAAAEALASERQRALEDAEAAHRMAREAELEANARVEAVKTERLRITPELEAARALDAELAPATRTLVEARRVEAEGEARILGAKAEAMKLETLEREQRQERERLLDRIATLQDVAKRAAEWPRWKAELVRFATSTRERTAAEARRASVAERLAGTERTEREAKAALLEVEGEAEAARTAVALTKDALEAKRRDAPPRGLRQAAERIGRELASLEQLLALAQGAKRADHLITEADRLEKEALFARERDESERIELETRITALELERAALEHAELRDRAKMELAERRHELLVDGEPCPLCGAREHPISKQAPTVRHEDPSREVRRQALAKEHAEACAALEAKTRAMALREDAGARARREAAQVLETLASTRVEWQNRRRGLEICWLDSPVLARLGTSRAAILIPADPSAASALDDLANAKALLERNLATIRLELDADDAALAAIDYAREQKDAIEHRRSAVTVEATRASEALARLRREDSELGVAIDTLRAREEELRLALIEPLGPHLEFEVRLERDPDGFIDGLEEEVQGFERLQTTQRNLEHALMQSAKALELARAALEHQSTRKAELSAARATAEARFDALDQARREHLAGRAVDEVLAECERDRDIAERATAAARAQILSTSADVARREAEARGANARMLEARAHAEAVTRPLSKACAELGIANEETLVEHLRSGPERIARIESELARVNQRLARAETTLADRAERLAAHEESACDPKDGSLEDRRSAQAMLARALEAKIERGAHIDLELAHDDSKRTALAEILPKIERERVALEAWAELSQLIGSADGKKFRTFAQGLSLDALLVEANQHLEDLRPRYRLRRVRGADLDLEVVDNDMGDEVRAAATLSGGERFLVSLALALALSTLAAKDVRIRSLFIDEGFGSLDPEALELALGVLDRLQAAGRTVGIISHVPQIAERLGHQVQVRPVAPGRSELSVLSV